MNHTPETLHIEQAKSMQQKLHYEPGAGFFAQKRAIGEKLTELLRPLPRTAPAQPIIEYTKDCGSYENTRFCYESEPGFFVPAHLLLPKAQAGKLPVVICLQGHSTGMYLSLGEKRMKRDGWLLRTQDMDYAVQAVKQGYAALILEQRGFGEQNASTEHDNTNCTDMVMQALILGRTLLGERCHDVSALIDLLPAFPALDTDKIGIMGQSGGGTVTIYSACTDTRIKVAMPSGSLCPYFDSIISLHHCSCNYLPGMFEQMEMADLTALIAPRPLVVVAGERDRIFPIDAVKRGFEQVRAIYDDAGEPDNCALVIGNEGHRFYAAQAWPLFRKYMEQL